MSNLARAWALFAGYDMPIQYPMGVLAEHLHTRKAAGLFDVSHMGQALIEGPDHRAGTAFLEELCPADLIALAPGRQRYTQLLNESGRSSTNLLIGKLLASTTVSILQVYAYLVVAWFWGIEAPVWGYVTVLPALAMSGLMLGALGMLLSSAIRQLENFAGVMNFVIFPMFFASSALYPLWLVQQSSPVVYTICRLNPFTYAVELICFALYAEIDWTSLAVVVVMTIVFTAGAIIAYDPARGLIARRGGGAG